jgi:uncharacterized membrane protein
MNNPVLIILFRFLHVATACVAVGGVFFIRVVFPVGLKSLDSESSRTVLLRTRRVFKMVVHTCILLLLISGTYNAILNWSGYTQAGPGVGHGLFGLHLLLALIVFGLALWMLAGAEPPADHQKWMAVNVVLVFLTIAAASTLKYVREHAKKPAATVTSTEQSAPAIMTTMP